MCFCSLRFMVAIFISFLLSLTAIYCRGCHFEDGHVLDCLPQRIDPDSFLLALHMAAEAARPLLQARLRDLPRRGFQFAEGRSVPEQSEGVMESEENKGTPLKSSSSRGVLLSPTMSKTA
ncbi:unnamed protein product [Musa acuminata subsp. burmannicoides]